MAPLVVGPVVVLHGPSLRACLDAVLRAARARRLNGLPPSAEHVRLAEALTSAMAATGQTDMPKTVAAEHVSHEDIPSIPLAEAARRLTVSARHARRLAPKLGGRRVGGRWFLDPVAVQEHLEGRQL